MKRETYERPVAEVVLVRSAQVLMGSTYGEQRDSWDEEE